MKADIRKIKEFYGTDIGGYAHAALSAGLDSLLKTQDLPTHNLCITSHGGYFYEDILRNYFTTLSRHTPDDEPDDVYSLRWATTMQTADCVVMIHDIEFSKLPDNHIAEAWRVLKDGGRLIIAFPNRAGGWSADDNTPFGFGTPQSLRQIKKLLSAKQFHIQDVKGFLYLPPYSRRMEFLRSFTDKTSGLCGFYKPGVIMIQAVKDKDKGSKIPSLSEMAENVGRALTPKPVTAVNNSQ